VIRDARGDERMRHLKQDGARPAKQRQPLRVHSMCNHRHYYGSHANLNPPRIVPIGPDLNYETPHGRERLVH
jgi:glutathionyl-hydroquinone reductase